jgi:N-formylglutamate amidohydrolase
VLADCFRQTFGPAVAVNQPFRGGFITRCHGRERPWVQLELSRAPFLSNEEKRVRVLESLGSFCRQVL